MARGIRVAMGARGGGCHRCPVGGVDRARAHDGGGGGGCEERKVISHPRMPVLVCLFFVSSRNKNQRLENVHYHNFMSFPPNIMYIGLLSTCLKWLFNKLTFVELCPMFIVKSHP